MKLNKTTKGKPKVNITIYPVFEQLVLDEKKTLGRIYTIAKEPEKLKSSDKYIISALELIKLTTLLERRSFNNQKDFYNFLLLNQMANLVVNFELSRDFCQNYYFNPERYSNIEYE